MKSAYELAMERFSDGEEMKQLTDQQKNEIAEVESKFQAKVAEKKLFLEKQIQTAEQKGDWKEADTIRKQLSDQIAILEEEKEKSKNKIRGEE
jgi:cysteinyl-tRNA synthetase